MYLLRHLVKISVRATNLKIISKKLEEVGADFTIFLNYLAFIPPYLMRKK